MTKEIRNEKFSWNILYIFVNRKGYENAGERQNILRDYRAEHGIGLSCVSITKFSMELLNAAEGCIGIIVSGWLTDSIIRSLLTLKLPLVVCGNNKLTLEVPSVTVNAEEGACRMTRIMLANGQRKIGIIHAEEGYYFGEQSKNWYCRAMKEAGWKVFCWRKMRFWNLCHGFGMPDTRNIRSLDCFPRNIRSSPCSKERI